MLGKGLAGQALSDAQKEEEILQKTSQQGFDEKTVRVVLSRVHRKIGKEMQGAYLYQTKHSRSRGTKDVGYLPGFVTHRQAALQP